MKCSFWTTVETELGAPSITENPEKNFIHSKKMQQKLLGTCN